MEPIQTLEGFTVMKNLDRAAARALVDAGYMPPADYFRLFGGESDAGVSGRNAQAAKLLPAAASKLPARFAPARASCYRVTYRARGGATPRKRTERKINIDKTSNDWRRSG